jgi:hypothetical protein
VDCVHMCKKPKMRGKQRRGRFLFLFKVSTTTRSVQE